MSLPPPHPRMERPAHREKKMQVLALGMPRTGTMSLYTALNKLGYTTYHMAEVILDAENDSATLWNEALDAKLHGKGKKWRGEDFDKMLWRYDAVADEPCVAFKEELLDAYPDAKIIITNRDVKSWQKSVETSILPVLRWRRFWYLGFLDRSFSRCYLLVPQKCCHLWTGTFYDDLDRWALGYHRHYDELRALCKAQGREVLEFRSQDGWEPLCKFLGKEIPKEPYPHVNESGNVEKMHYALFWGRVMATAQNALRWIAPMSFIGGATYYYLNSQK